MDVLSELTYRIKAEAHSLGFSACGVAKACPVDKEIAERYRIWVSEGKYAGMQYLASNIDKRLDPTLLMPGAKSIISLALNYYPERKLRDDQYQFAYYAYGKDYHDVIKAKLLVLAKCIEDLASQPVQLKLCVDTVPVLDRYWAWRAGLGWIGKNTNLIIPKAGSFFFLAEVITDLELMYDSPMESHCGTCDKCVRACPTGALSAPYDIDANKCLSYLTIEHRGEFDTQSAIHNLQSEVCYIYGCDRCQLACPYNKFAVPTKIQEFTPSDEFLSMRPSDWKSLSVERYRAIFKGSAVKRAKYEGLLRNIRCVDNLHDVIHNETSG